MGLLTTNVVNFYIFLRGLIIKIADFRFCDSYKKKDNDKSKNENLKKWISRLEKTTYNHGQNILALVLNDLK